MSFQNQNVLITGGCGFIGHHLIKKLITMNPNIYIIDLPKVNQKKIRDFKDQVQLIEADIVDAELIQSIVNTIKPDYVFHLAGYGINSIHNDIKKAIDINIFGSVNLMNAVSDTNCKMFVNMGSSAEYGDKICRMETSLNPNTIYGSTKASSTLILHQIARQKDMPIITLRPFGIYGEWEEPHKLFSYIMLSILNNQELALTGCRQRRNYVYVGDIVEAMIASALTLEVKDEMIDLASKESLQIKDFVEMICTISQTALKPKYGALAYRPGEVFFHEGNTSKSKQLLNWEAHTTIHDGISKTFNWFQSNYKMF